MKNRKWKITGWMLIIAMCYFLSGCVERKDDSVSALYKKGLEVVEKMDRVAECEEYIELFSSSLELSSLIDEIGKKDYTKPDTVFRITITQEAIDTILFSLNGAKLQIPEEIMPNIYRRFFLAVPSTLNAAEGATVLTATSLLMSDTDFLYKDLTENTMYLYLYKNAYSAMVLFSPMDDGIVRATGNFILTDGLLWNLTEEEIVDLLEETGYFIGCEIQRVEIQ